MFYKILACVWGVIMMSSAAYSQTKAFNPFLPDYPFDDITIIKEVIGAASPETTTIRIKGNIIREEGEGGWNKPGRYSLITPDARYLVNSNDKTATKIMNTAKLFSNFYGRATPEEQENLRANFERLHGPHIKLYHESPFKKAGTKKVLQKECDYIEGGNPVISPEPYLKQCYWYRISLFSESTLATKRVWEATSIEENTGLNDALFSIPTDYTVTQKERSSAQETTDKKFWAMFTRMTKKNAKAEDLILY